MCCNDHTAAVISNNSYISVLSQISPCSRLIGTHSFHSLLTSALDTLVPLPLGKNPKHQTPWSLYLLEKTQVLTEQEAPEPVWTFSRREKSLAPGRNQTPHCPVHSLVTTLHYTVQASCISVYNYNAFHSQVVQHTTDVPAHLQHCYTLSNAKPLSCYYTVHPSCWDQLQQSAKE